MQTAVVAGGAGFIGSHLCASLLHQNLSVICIDNLITGDKKNITDLLNNSNFRFIEADVTNSLDLPQKVDYIFHLASPASPSKINTKSYIHKPLETLLVNSKGTHNLLGLSKKNEARFLFASSSEVYGDPKISPQNEDYWGNVNPVGIRSVYDEGKRFGETISMAYSRTFGLDVRIARIFNTYGPKMPDDGRVIYNFIKQATNNEPITVYGDGTQTRSLCFVDDLVGGLEKLMFEESAKNEIVNLGNPEEMKVLEIANLIIELTNSKSKITNEELPEDDPKKRKPDISKAKKLLSWTPMVTPREGLEKTIAFFKL